MNKRGFTLVELLATIVVLSIVMSIAAISIVSLINNAREKEYQLLIKNIKSAAENYYQECKFAKAENIGCTKEGKGYKVYISMLVTNGLLSGNGSDADKNKVYDPRHSQDDDYELSRCLIKIEVDNNNKFVVSNIYLPTAPKGCPIQY